MNSLIETLNLWGERFIGIAWPMLWQSSVLIAVLAVLDFALRRRLRASVRYAIWLVLLVKLLLPPSLALPTSLAWWLQPNQAPPAPVSKPKTSFVVTYGQATTVDPSPIVQTAYTPPPPHLSYPAWALAVWTIIGVGLLGWMLIRWRQVAGDVRRAAPASGWLNELLDETRRQAGLRKSARLRLTDRPMSPAVFGLFRPMVLLPRPLTEQLPPAQLRAVLLHELLHLRRGDVWVNCAQALLQIVYWWHPLLWLANVRIRRVREEAVDDAVMLALRDNADTYAPTLLEVAKLAFDRPLATLGLVGILESRSALRQRIERLVNFRAPRKAGLTLASVIAILAFSAVALPMGEAPPRPAAKIITNSVDETFASAQSNTNLWPDPRFNGYLAITNLRVLFLIVDESRLRAVLPMLASTQKPFVMASNEIADLKVKLQQAGTRNYFDAEVPWDSEPILLAKFSGARLHWRVGGYSNSVVMPITTGGIATTGKLLGFEADLAATQPDWTPLNFTLVPWVEGDSIRCQVEMTPRDKANATRQAEATIPPAGALIWAMDEGTSPGKRQLVVLQNHEAVPRGEAPHTTATRMEGKTMPSIPVAAANEGNLSTNLLTRLYKVDTNIFLGNLWRLTGKPATNPIQETLTNYFAVKGVTFQPPQAVFFAADRGLLVRAMLPQMDLVEKIVVELNTAPPQVNIKVIFVELSENNSNALGFDWFLGNMPTNNTPSSTGAPANPSGVFPGNVAAATTTPAGATVQKPTGGPQNTGPAPGTLTGTLTDPQFRTVHSELRERDGVSVLTEMEATTLSSRQLQTKATDLRTIIQGINPQALVPPGVQSTNGDSPIYLKGQIDFGQTLDIVPTVAEDATTIELTIIASVTEFLGYEQTNRTQRVYVDGKEQMVPLPQPKIHVRTLKTKVPVRDGQTLVLGNLTDEVITFDQQAQPFAESGDKKKHILVFVTPTIIDSAGNRVHNQVESP